MKFMMIAVLLLVGAGCASFPKKIAPAVEYQATGNDVARINLTMADDHSFQLHFQATGDPKESVLHGAWKELEEDYLLAFAQTTSKTLEALFMFEQNPSLSRQGPLSIRFSKEARGILIWGVTCLKAK